MPTIGVVVPALAAGGGVPAVAAFLCTQIERSARYHLEIFSLATSRHDGTSFRLTAPSSWLGHPKTRPGTWEGRPFLHVGATGAELEFRRVAPSALLRRAVAGCDLLQVVSGSAAPAWTLRGCTQPVVLQVATRAVAERRRRLQSGSLPIRAWRTAMTRVIDRCDRRALGMVDAVMVENRSMWEYCSAAVTPGKLVRNAPPGIDCAWFAPSATRHARLIEDPYVLFVGRLADPRKNIPLLCRAYVRLRATLRVPPRLVLAGEGALPEAARAILSTAGVLQYVEHFVEPSARVLRGLYQYAACLALPSDEEGFGLVVVEALACGTPVVATRCGGPEEILTPDVDGFLVPLDDADAMARYIGQLCESATNERMSRAARATAVERFSAAAAFQPYLEIYEKLLR